MPVHRLLPAILTALVAKTSCAPPSARLEPVSIAAVQAEELVQQQALMAHERAEQRRLEQVVQPLLRAAAPLCVGALGDPGEPRDRGDPGEAATASSAHAAEVTPTGCAFEARLVRDDGMSAWADGHAMMITAPMLRFAASDDALAVVMAHEIAHNALRHSERQLRHARRGLLAGAALDALAAVSGLNSGGTFSHAGRQLGALASAHDTEREADYVGAYILARAGRDVREAGAFWRRVALESPGTITYAARHPSTAERFVRMRQAAEEIARKRVAGTAILPTLNTEGGRVDGSR